MAPAAPTLLASMPFAGGLCCSFRKGAEAVSPTLQSGWFSALLLLTECRNDVAWPLSLHEASRLPLSRWP